MMSLVGMYVVKVADSYAVERGRSSGFWVLNWGGAADDYAISQGRVVGEAFNGDTLVEWDSGVTRAVGSEGVQALNLFNTREKADAYATAQRVKNEQAIAEYKVECAERAAKREAEEAAKKAAKRKPVKTKAATRRR